MCKEKKYNLLLLYSISFIIITSIFSEPLWASAKGLPQGMKEQQLTAEAVYDAGVGKNVYFDESGNQVEDFDASYYGAIYRAKYVIDFWNSGALSSSIGKKYSTATITAVLIPDGSAYASDEGQMVREALAAWENKHFDEYKNDPAWVEANKQVLADIEAIKSKDLPIVKEPVMTLYFTGGPNGEFKVPETSEKVGKVVQKSADWVVEFPKGINHSAHTNSNNLFFEFRITTVDPFGVANQERVDTGCRFAGLSGQVEVRPGFDEDAWDFAEMGMILYTEDHIKTGPRSGAIISFQDLSTYVMKSDSEIILATPPEKETKLQLVAGNLWVNVKKLIKDGTMEITMNQAVSGIKGTIFVCEETGTTSTIKVIEGEVAFTDNNGKTISVGSGKKVSATNSGMSEIESFDIKAEQEAWAELLDSKSVSSKSQTNTPTKKINLSLIIGVSTVLVVVVGLLIIMNRRKRNR
jgi:hypothetical protein